MYYAVRILAIYDWIWFMWAVLEAIGGLVIVFGELFPDVGRHGNVDTSVSIVPFQVNSTV